MARWHTAATQTEGVLVADIDVEVLVIGWGKGGKTLAGALGKQGRTVALVEQSAQMYGGTCINVACVPTKDLIHSASQRRDGDNGRAFFAQAVAGRDALTDQLRARNHQLLDRNDHVTLIDGRARFTGPHDVEVMAGDEQLTVHAQTVVINTGTVPAPPPFPIPHDHVYNSTTIQHVSPLPERLVIVGAGYVGLEFAGMFADFGCAVTLIDRGDRFLKHEDPDVASSGRALLEGVGVEIALDTEVEQISSTPENTGVTLDLTRSGQAERVTADAVLVAVGRVPVSAGLGLEAAGVDVDERGYVVVDEHLRTTAANVFAVGDINGGPQFTYISMDDYRIVLDQLTGNGSRSTKDRAAVPQVTFLTPPLARVGLNETQARDSGREVLVASKNVADIAAMPRPKIVGQTEGLIKVIIDAETDLVLGATVFSTDAQEVINLVALAMRHDVTATELRDGMWTHPSSTEALNEVLASPQPLAG